MALDEVLEEIPIVGEGNSNRNRRNHFRHFGTCRICLNRRKCLISVYDGFSDDLCYKEIYQECIGKPLKDFKNHLPLICQDCEDELLQAYKFRKMCFEAEDVLNELENFPIQIKREIVEEYPENLFTNETQDEAAEEPRLNILSVASGKDNYIPELMDIEDNAEESLNGKDNHVPELLDTGTDYNDDSLEESLHDSTINSIQQIPLMEESSTEVQDEMCRICCKYKHKLFSFYDRFYDDVPYTEIYQHTIGHPLKDHGNLHLWICQLCEGLMLQAFKFRKKCLQTDERLEQIEEQTKKDNQLITDIKEEIEDISFTVDDTNNLQQQEEENETTTNDQHDEQPTISTMDKETTYNPVNSCRICLKPKNNVRPFKDGIFEELPYKEIYQECIRRPLKDYKDYPSLICQLCEGDLLQFFLFRKKCLEADEKLTELEEENDTNDLLMEMMEENNLPTINSTKTDTNPPNDEPENKDVAEESQPKKKVKVDEENSGNKIKKTSSATRKDCLRLSVKENAPKANPIVTCVPKVMLVKFDQPTALKELTSLKEPQETEGKRITRSSKSMTNPKSKVEVVHDHDDENNYRKKFKCEKCTKYFKSPLCLKNHMKIHEENLKCIKCKICAKNVPQCTFERHMYKHDNHIQNNHTADGKKTLTCPQCPKVFSNRAGLRYHKINQHTVTEMQRCRICKKKVKKPIMNYHMTRHEKVSKNR